MKLKALYTGACGVALYKATGYPFSSTSVSSLTFLAF